MKRLRGISDNRALLVLCAVGFLGMSSGLATAQGFAEGRYSVDFDAKTNTRDAAKTNRTKVKVAPGEKRGRSTWAARYIQGGTGAFNTDFKTKSNSKTKK